MKSPSRTRPDTPVPAGGDEGATHARAFTKAVTWRVIGTLDTFLWSLLVTGHVVSAGKIASLETLTKVLLFYLHERVWRLIPWDPHARARSFVKAVAWRFVGSLDTFVLSLIVTGNARYAVSIASLEALSKIVLYYVHERVWRRIRWGRLESRRVESEPVAPASTGPGL